MPNLLDIRRRIRTVKNTQQITKAMKMVSAAKLRRAQEQAFAARPYAQGLESLLREVAAYVDFAALAGDPAGQTAAALLARRPVRRIQIVAVSSDKGLAGAFNANVVKAVLGFAAEYPSTPVQLELVGRKVRDYFRRHTFAVSGEHVGAFGKTVDYAVAHAVAQRIVERYVAGEVDEVYLAGSEFKTMLQQRVEIRRVLPIDVSAATTPAAHARDFIFDTPPSELLGSLLPRYVETLVYRALLESFAAEHAARMNAMESATNNAGDLIDALTLNMNRVRQAAITKEIIEIVSGAAALES